jgi:hypothetical protein
MAGFSRILWLLLIRVNALEPLIWENTTWRKYSQVEEMRDEGKIDVAHPLGGIRSGSYAISGAATGS